jgi:periplasmic protein TonB
MKSATPLSTAAAPEPPPAPRLKLQVSRPMVPPAQFRFESLVLTEPTSLVKGRSATLMVSLLVHSVLVAAAILIPILTYDYLPAPGEVVRAFFVSPPDLAPPPPPPPPPPAGARVTRAPAAPHPVEPAKFVAPIEVPAEVKPEESLDLGVEGGVPGGVEGGVPGGVVGGIIGGLPAEPPPAPKRMVRIGGNLVAPKLVRKVNPEYPALAAQARVAAVLILEAEVDTHGQVQTVRVLRGQPLFDEAAVAAVKQWRYQPLLLNGVPTDFVLTVTLVFNLHPQAKEQP